MTKSKYLIVTPSLARNDAVSIDVLSEQKVLKSEGYEVFLYCQYTDSFTRDKIISWQKVLHLLEQSSTVVIYHHSIYWEEGGKIFDRATGDVILKYHNITPAQYIEHLNTQRQVTLGRWQTQKFIDSKRIKLFVSDSQFNSSELEKYGAPRGLLRVSAPFNRIEELESIATDEVVNASLDKAKVNILFVGRIVINKAQLNLVKLIERYRELYGDVVHLYLVGKVESTQYFETILNYIKSNGLGKAVTLHVHASPEELMSYYRNCDLFVCLSEHEGFCVPIVEAQFNRLPVIALDKTAVGETLGEAQIKFPELDFDKLCAAIKVIYENQEYKKYLIEAGRKNFEKYRFENLSRQFLQVVLGENALPH